MRLALQYCAITALVILAGCSHESGEDQLIGKWANHHVAAKQPAIVSVEFLPKNTVTISDVDTLAAAGWHRQTTSTGQYHVIAPGKLKITEELGSTVLDYHIDGTRLILSGDGLAEVLGRPEPPQVLDKSD
ncbi:MAG: hypothetical protein ACYDCA_01435 [Candidatus Tyrphobacter sp.]